MFIKSTISGLGKKSAIDTGQLPGSAARGSATDMPYAAQTSDMLSLYRSLNSVHPGVKHKVLLFVAANPGEGTSTIVNGLALAAAECLRDRVLILSASMGNRAVADAPVHPLVSHAALSDSQARKAELADPQVLADKLRSRREEFDLVLVDCAATSQSDLCFALAPMSDGVVLVLEADKTRSPVLEMAITRMLDAGARIVGAVLNKRQYFIPKRLYDLL